MNSINGILLLLFLTVVTVHAQTLWHFEAAEALTLPSASPVFIHLDGSNRQHLALSENMVAVSWEDDRSGDPQVYLSVKKGNSVFKPPMKVSEGDEAYEPSIAAMPQDSFVIAYEQDGRVYARAWQKSLTAASMGVALPLSTHESGQVTLVSLDDRLYAAWRERLEGRWQLVVAGLQLDGNQLRLITRKPVEPEPLTSSVLFPALALTPSGLCVAWEDRRAGHTRLLYSVSTDLGNSFSKPAYLNEFFSNRNEYDKGNGVTRVSLAGFGEDEVIAAWMDKRRGHAGYGIFGALGTESGLSFGPNEKIHAQKGDEMPHYNPVAVGNRDGLYVVVWDDFRLGNADIWLSYHNDDFEWSEDYAPAVASGAGEQTHASAKLDAKGNLHLLWLTRGNLDAPGQLWYSKGILNK